MQITVSGKHIDVGASLQQHVQEHLSSTVNKYFERAIHARVVFSKEAHLFRTDILVDDGVGKRPIMIKSDAAETDIYASFDTALSRVEKQLRRYKRRLKNHQQMRADEFIDYSATHYVLSSDEEEAHEDEHPLIIAEQPGSVETLSVGDAVMRMDLGDLPALMFINSQNGTLNVVYRRPDGNIAWVDPKVEEGKRKVS